MLHLVPVFLFTVPRARLANRICCFLAIILEAFYMRAIFELQPNCSSRRETNYAIKSPVYFEDTSARRRKGEEASLPPSSSLRVLPPSRALKNSPKEVTGARRAG